MKEGYLKLDLTFGIPCEREADILDRCAMTGENFEDHADELKQAAFDEDWGGELEPAEWKEAAWQNGYKEYKAYADAWEAQPLVASLERGHVEFFDKKVAEGTDVNARDVDGATALHHSARGQIEIVAKLLQHGADPRLSDNNGLTPIRYAEIAGNEPVALLLAAVQAEYDARDLATAIDGVRPPETVPEPPAPAHLFAGPNDPPVKSERNRPQYEDLGADDPQPIKAGRMRL
jgi:hypothetical protein